MTIKNYKLYIFVLVFLGIANVASSQNSKLDSLKGIAYLATADSNQVNVLKDIGDFYYEENFDSTLYFYNKALTLSREIPYYNMELSTLRSFGYVYSNKKNDYATSLKYFNEAFDLATAQNDSLGMAFLLSDIGRIYWKQGQTPQALEYHLKVKAIGEKLNNQRIMLRANQSLGIIQNEDGDNEKAKVYYMKALAIAKDLKRERSIGLLLNNIGNSYQDDKDYETALNYFEQAETVFLKIEDSNWLSLVNYNKGKNFTLRNHLDKGIALYKKALNFNKKIGNKEREVMINAGLALSYQKKDNPYQSILIAEKALKTLKTIDTDLYYEELYQILSEDYDLVGDYYKSLENHKNYVKAKEMKKEVERTKEIAKLNHLYELEKQENKILELKAKDFEQEKDLKKSQQNFLFLAFTSLSLLLGVLLFFYWSKMIDLKKFDELKSSLSKDLHDNIGASLNHIKMLSSRLNKSGVSYKERTNDIGRIKSISNEVIYNMYDMVWSLDKKKETVANLLERMQDHLDNVLGDFDIPFRFKVEDIDEKRILKIKEKINIYLIFKEAINNILKHTKPENVMIDFTKDGSRYFKMTIVNFYKTKTKIDKSSNQKGIENMKMRAKEVGGELQVFEKDNSFIVVFFI